MAATDVPVHPTTHAVVDLAPLSNDFSITIATVNGSGSQSANNTLLRAIHRMGVPVSGKNIFPSNIQGLPTWFTVRVSKDGYLGRCEQARILVAMNRASIREDVAALASGGICLFPVDFPPPVMRDDVTFYPMPVDELVKLSGVENRLKPYIANMVYVGVLAYLLDMDLNEVEEAVSYHFSGKQKAITLNYGTLKAAYDWSMVHLDRKHPYRVEPMDATKGTFLIDGNCAAALGAIFGGGAVRCLVSHYTFHINCG